MSDNHAVAILADAVPANADHPAVIAIDQAVASDDSSEVSSISTAVVAVHDAERRTTRMMKRLDKTLRKTSSAVDKTADTYAYVIVLSDDIDRNYLSHDVRARRASDQFAAVFVQSRAIVTAI